MHVDLFGHLRWHKLLDAYVDGELAGARREAVALHLGRCRWCSHQAELLLAVKESLTRRQVRLPSLVAARLRRWAAGLSDQPLGTSR